MRKLGAALFLGIFLMLQMALPAGAESTPREVVLSGVNGQVTAWPGEHHVEVTLASGGTTAFNDARIIVKRDRISIMARNNEKTLYAWANRVGGGGIGLVVRSRDRRVRARSYGAYVNNIELDGTSGILRR